MKQSERDNGPEFIPACVQEWLKAQEIKTLYIKPGSPWENGHIESFHDKLRDECLNRELFDINESVLVEFNVAKNSGNSPWSFRFSGQKD
jgi:transposase InsO family protein